MFYKAHIRNIDRNKWLKGENQGSITLIENMDESLKFHDQSEAIQTLEYLNDTFSDCYTLVEDDKYRIYLERELVGKHDIESKATKRIFEHLNASCLYDDILAETEFDKDEGKVVINIRCFEQSVEVHHFIFDKNGIYITDHEYI